MGEKDFLENYKKSENEFSTPIKPKFDPVH